MPVWGTGSREFEPRQPDMWRIVPEFPDYRVSDAGQVESRKSGAWLPLTTFRGADKYHRAVLFRGRGREERQVHDLVLLAFVGPKPIKAEVRHLDGDIHNNSLNNLEYGDHRSNAEDRKRHGTMWLPKGSKNTQAKLNEYKVLEIRRRLARGDDLNEIAATFGVAWSTIHSIRIGETWGHVE